MALIKVGHHEKKEVTARNNHLYLVAKDTIDENKNRSYIGWQGVGCFIDWLTGSYLANVGEIEQCNDCSEFYLVDDMVKTDPVNVCQGCWDERGLGWIG